MVLPMRTWGPPCHAATPAIPKSRSRDETLRGQLLKKKQSMRAFMRGSSIYVLFGNNVRPHLAPHLKSCQSVACVRATRSNTQQGGAVRGKVEVVMRHATMQVRMNESYARNMLFLASLGRQLAGMGVERAETEARRSKTVPAASHYSAELVAVLWQ